MPVTYDQQRNHLQTNWGKMHFSLVLIVSITDMVIELEKAAIYVGRAS